VDGRPSATPSGDGFWERNYDTFFAVNQLFEIGGKRSNRQKSAEAGFEAARFRFEDARRVLDTGVTKDYLDTLLGESKAKILMQSAHSLRKEADLAALRFKAGDISEADKEQIEIAAERFELDSKTAEANAASLKIALEVLLGIKEPRGNLKLTDSLEELAQKSQPISETKDGSDRPDLMAAEANLKKTEADLRLQKALRIPDPTFLLQYEHNPPDQPNTLGVGVAFPLPLFSHNAGNIRSAAVARDEAARQVEKTKAQIASDIGISQLNYQEALHRWKNYRDVVRPKSARILDSVTFAYEKGAASYLDLLAAQRNDNEVRIATAQAAVDTVEAQTNLKSAMNLTELQPLQPESKEK
jgi:cobalt-zinc-cadmium efflux system outer membrane protein